MQSRPIMTPRPFGSDLTRMNPLPLLLMKQLCLADSSFLISKLRSRIDPFQIFKEHRDRYDFATCEIVMLEVLRGIRGARALRYAQAEFEKLIYVPIQKSTGVIALGLAQHLERAGCRVAVPDLLIAACAKEIGAAVLSFDQHFARMPELTISEGF